MPGKAQTVPRAELQACIEIIADQTSDGTTMCTDPLHIWSDSKYVVDKWLNGPAQRPPPQREANHEMWERFWRIAAYVPGLRITKVMAHVTKISLP